MPAPSKTKSPPRASRSESGWGRQAWFHSTPSMRFRAAGRRGENVGRSSGAGATSGALGGAGITPQAGPMEGRTPAQSSLPAALAREAREDLPPGQLQPAEGSWILAAGASAVPHQNRWLQRLTFPLVERTSAGTSCSSRTDSRPGPGAHDLPGVNSSARRPQRQTREGRSRPRLVDCRVLLPQPSCPLLLGSNGVSPPGPSRRVLKGIVQRSHHRLRKGHRCLDSGPLLRWTSFDPAPAAPSGLHLEPPTSCALDRIGPPQDRRLRSPKGTDRAPVDRFRLPPTVPSARSSAAPSASGRSEPARVAEARQATPLGRPSPQVGSHRRRRLRLLPTSSSGRDSSSAGSPDTSEEPFRLGLLLERLEQ